MNEVDKTGRELGFTTDEIDADTFESLHRRTVIDPYKMLLIAILERAWIDLQEARKNRQRQEAAEVLEWFNAEDERLFGFVAICQYLEIPPERIRKRVRK